MTRKKHLKPSNCDMTDKRAAPDAIRVVELHDVTPTAKDLGFACSVSIAQPLLDEVAPEPALRRLHEVVLTTTNDPSMELFRAVMRGERPAKPHSPPVSQDAVTRFTSHVRAGVGGVSEGGTMVAFHVEGSRGPVMMVCQLGFGIVRPGQSPSITLTTADAASFYVERIAMRSLR